MTLLQTLPADPTVLIPATSGVAVAADIAMIAVTVALLLIMLVMLFAVFQVRRGLISLREAVARLEPGSHALLERARGVTENVEAITGSVRGDVEALTGSVQALSERLHQASDRMEERVEDFNALMEVVQEEAEGIFVGTASAVRGLQGGARALSGPVPETDDDPLGPADAAMEEDPSGGYLADPAAHPMEDDLGSPAEPEFDELVSGTNEDPATSRSGKGEAV